MSVFLRLFLLLACLTLSSCSYISRSSVFNTNNKNYLAAKSIPPLRIPPGLSSDKIETTYAVSNRTYPKEYLDIDLTPPGLNQ
jgi:uncharacterized lipoprotein